MPNGRLPRGDAVATGEHAIAPGVTLVCSADMPCGGSANKADPQINVPRFTVRSPSRGSGVAARGMGDGVAGCGAVAGRKPGPGWQVRGNGESPGVEPPDLAAGLRMLRFQSEKILSCQMTLPPGWVA